MEGEKPCKNMEVDTSLAIELCALCDDDECIRTLYTTRPDLGVLDDAVAVERAVQTFATCGALNCLLFAVENCDQARKAVLAVHGGYVITLAAEAGEAGIVREILRMNKRERALGKNKEPSTVEAYALRLACQFNHANVIRALIDAGVVDNNEDRDNAFSLAALWGSEDAIKTLLDWNKDYPEKPRIDVTSNESYAVRVACKNGFAGVVKLLLEHGANPAARHNEPIKSASQHGHFQVAELLLSTGQVDPGVHGGFPIRWAARNGYLDLIPLLLKHGVKAEDHDYAALTWAASYNQAAALSLLGRHIKGDKRIAGASALEGAATYGHVECVQILLTEFCVDPAAKSNYVLQMAAANGHAGVVELLLQDPRVNPSASDDAAFRGSICAGHLHVARILLEKGVIENSSAMFALKHAVENGDDQMAKEFVGYADVDTLKALGERALTIGFKHLARILTDKAQTLRRPVVMARNATGGIIITSMPFAPASNSTPSVLTPPTPTTSPIAMTTLLGFTLPEALVDRKTIPNCETSGAVTTTPSSVRPCTIIGVGRGQAWCTRVRGCAAITFETADSGLDDAWVVAVTIPDGSSVRVVPSDNRTVLSIPGARIFFSHEETTNSTTPTSAMVTASSLKSNDPSTSTTQHAVGIAVGSICVGAAVILGIVYWFKARSKKRNLSNEGYPRESPWDCDGSEGKSQYGGPAGREEMRQYQPSYPSSLPGRPAGRAPSDTASVISAKRASGAPDTRHYPVFHFSDMRVYSESNLATNNGRLRPPTNAVPNVAAAPSPYIEAASSPVPLEQVITDPPGLPVSHPSEDVPDERKAKSLSRLLVPARVSSRAASSRPLPLAPRFHKDTGTPKSPATSASTDRPHGAESPVLSLRQVGSMQDTVQHGGLSSPLPANSRTRTADAADRKVERVSSRPDMVRQAIQNPRVLESPGGSFGQDWEREAMRLTPASSTISPKSYYARRKASITDAEDPVENEAAQTIGESAAEVAQVYIAGPPRKESLDARESSAAVNRRQESSGALVQPVLSEEPGESGLPGPNSEAKKGDIETGNTGTDLVEPYELIVPVMEVYSKFAAQDSLEKRGLEGSGRQSNEGEETSVSGIGQDATIPEGAEGPEESVESRTEIQADSSGYQPPSQDHGASIPTSSEFFTSADSPTAALPPIERLERGRGLTSLTTRSSTNPRRASHLNRLPDFPHPSKYSIPFVSEPFLSAPSAAPESREATTPTPVADPTPSTNTTTLHYSLRSFATRRPSATPPTPLASSHGHLPAHAAGGDTPALLPSKGSSVPHLPPGSTSTLRTDHHALHAFLFGGLTGPTTRPPSPTRGDRRRASSPNAAVASDVSSRLPPVEYAMASPSGGLFLTGETPPRQRGAAEGAGATGQQSGDELAKMFQEGRISVAEYERILQGKRLHGLR
ncbi:hypothetical protein HDU96_009353 [Phlyctochytrium bullatum]|nr:hypothetical protein HDU96_009353 [Phlyctochytrium bullatum]